MKESKFQKLEREIAGLMSEGFSVDYMLEILNPEEDPEIEDMIWNIYEEYTD